MVLLTHTVVNTSSFRYYSLRPKNRLESNIILHRIVLLYWFPTKNDKWFAFIFVFLLLLPYPFPVCVCIFFCLFICFFQFIECCKKGANLLIQGPDHGSLLHHAAKTGHGEIVKYILEHGESQWANQRELYFSQVSVGKIAQHSMVGSALTPCGHPQPNAHLQHVWARGLERVRNGSDDSR